MTPEEEIAQLKERVAYLEDLMRMYVVTGNQQFESGFQDWKKKQGLYVNRK